MFLTRYFDKLEENKANKELKDKPKAKEPVHMGGGWYELPNGNRIRGKEEAFKVWSERDGTI